MTKRKRTNQKKTHPKLYQNKRSLARKVPKTRCFWHFIFLHFYRKIDFDPNLTPKHQKRKMEQDNTSCSISFID